MRRVVVLGTSGAGKTTVATALSRRCALPYVDLDDLSGGGRPIAVDEFRRLVDDVVAGEAWVVDGDYERMLGDRVLERADTAVWLDVPLRVSLASAIRRERQRPHREPLVYRNRRGLPAWALWLQWEARSHLRRKRELARRLARHPHLTPVRLRSRADADTWVRGVTRAAYRPGPDPGRVRGG